MNQPMRLAFSMTQRPGYRIYQAGQHIGGTYIRVYVPDQAMQPGATLQAITYLHGFALCMPEFYAEHLEKLVQDGYIVFFPDFQRSCYPNTSPDEKTPRRPREIDHFGHWLSVTQLSGNAEQPLTMAETPTLSELCEKGELGRGFSAPKRGDLRRVAWALVIVIALLNLSRWFRREYGKNLIHLLSTVAMSLVHPPTEGLQNAIALVHDAWDTLCEDFPHWRGAEVRAFAFGHSLGGLMALSLPFAYNHIEDQRFYPSKIVVADPAASTEMGIPGFAIALLKWFKSPFTQHPIEMTATGSYTTVPVAILHGAADRLVKPSTWKTQQGYTQNFTKIASPQKQVYFSDSNADHQPPLVAFHNQAVTSTQYYDDGLFENFGGVKDGANAYNFGYVWPGATLIYQGQATPTDLLSHLPPHPFAIELEPPKVRSRFWLGLGLAVLGLGLVLGWRFGMG